MSQITQTQFNNNADKRVLQMREKAREDGVPILRDASFNFLQTLVRAKQPKRILEIGSAYGCTSVAMLLQSPDSVLSAIEINENSIRIARENYRECGLTERINIFAGDASEIMPLLTGKYDFIFLDGPKGHYFEYLPYIMDLLENDGLLFADNLLFHGVMENDIENCPKKHHTIFNSLKNFLDAITSDERLLTTVLDLEDGVSLSIRIKQ